MVNFGEYFEFPDRFKLMQHCTVTNQIQTRCKLFHCQCIRQYCVFNVIEDGLFLASSCITVRDWVRCIWVIDELVVTS